MLRKDVGAFSAVAQVRWKKKKTKHLNFDATRGHILSAVSTVMGETTKLVKKDFRQ